MTKLQEGILEIFTEFKIPVEGALHPHSVNSRIRNWDVLSQDESTNAIKELINDEFIGLKDNLYILTQKGYDYLNRFYNIEKTENIILEFLRKQQIRTGDIIMGNWFSSLRSQIDRIHVDNFDKALQNTIDKQFIENNPRGLFLTQKGYNKIYT